MDIARRKVWECIGCGRIDDPRPCVGICRDSKVEYVLAADHDRAVAALLDVVRTIATTNPRAGEADLIVAKHRNGRTDDDAVAFQGQYSRFADMPRT